MSTQITEKRVRAIAKEESEKACAERMKEIEKQLSENSKTLAKIERLLLGEFGDSNEALKAKATFAYQYAKHNSDLKIVDRALPALVWFEDMNRREPGCEESKLDTLGRMISAYTSLKWILRLIGFTSILNLVLSIEPVVELIKSLFS